MMVISGFTASAKKPAGQNTADIFTCNKYLAKTLTIAFTFDAPKEGAWGHTLATSDFKLIKKAGFTAIRLPVQWVTRMDTTAPYLIDNIIFKKRIDWAIQQALKNHLAIILDNHIDNQLMANPEHYKERYLSLWKQLSAHYKASSRSRLCSKLWPNLMENSTPFGMLILRMP